MQRLVLLGLAATIGTASAFVPAAPASVRWGSVDHPKPRVGPRYQPTTRALAPTIHPPTNID